MDEILRWTLEEAEKGYTHDTENESYVCNICHCGFDDGEVFKVGERFYCAEKMAEIHIATEHGNMLDVLMSYGKSHTGLTDNQRELLSMISSGLSDREIADKTGTAAATIRHQRFMFREKAKQARLYLAIYELAERGKRQSRSVVTDNEEFMDIHGGAKMIDERYQITKEEETAILANMFSSLQPLKLKNLSPKEKKKIVILKKIAGQFEPGRKYSEKEINAVLEDIYDDFATIRRYLIEYGFMNRTNDGKEYWLK
jgi:hypothetical protein